MSFQRINNYILFASEQEQSIGSNELRALTVKTPLVDLALSEANMLVNVEELQREYKADRGLSVDVLRDPTPNIVFGTSVPCTVPYTGLTTDRVVLVTQRLTASFTMNPFEYGMSTITEQNVFNKNMAAVEAGIQKQIENILLLRLDTERNTVWNSNNQSLAAQNGGSIDVGANHILVDPTGRDLFISSVPSYLNGNDLDGDMHRIIGSTNLQQHVWYAANQGEQNARNLAFQYEKTRYLRTTNNITPSVIGVNPAFATGYFFTAGSIGLINLIDPNYTQERFIDKDSIFYSTEPLPKSGLKFMYRYSKSCGNTSVASGLPSLTAAPVESYTFFVDIMTVSQYNPDPLKSTSIFKFQMLN